MSSSFELHGPQSQIDVTRYSAAEGYEPRVRYQLSKNEYYIGALSRGDLAELAKWIIDELEEKHVE